ncbi:MAG TPA: hypothetical protein VKY35_08895 [Aliidiomarina sp.]|nr:hypothetical protein [Aliidiomarina sp.]
MSQRQEEKLKKIIKKGKWSYVLKYGVIGWGLLTAIAFSGVLHFIGSTPFSETIVFSLIVFPIGGIFWGLFMWFYLSREYKKLEHSNL